MASKSGKNAKKKVTKKKAVASKKKITAKKKVAKKSTAAKPVTRKKSTAKKARRAITTKPGMTPKAASSQQGSTLGPVSAAERHQMIATMAYYRWERRGRLPGFEEQDWLESEKAVDAMLRNRKG